MQQNNVKGADPDKPKCRKAKEIRLENKLMKLSKGACKDFDSSLFKNRKCNIEKSIEDFIDEVSYETCCCKLDVRLVSVNDKKKFDPMFETEFDLFCKYQQIIHGDSIDKLSQRRFRRFLVDGPLKYIHPSQMNDVPSIGLGAFHQQYFLDGKLVAVGVLDILPHYVSSKYFFYDPDYSFLSLGTYSALREIYLVRWLNQESTALKYYYMGYYISNCPKMKYKAQYHPSYLLCPETYLWQPIETCISKFSVSNYSRLEEDKTKKAPDVPHVTSAFILHEHQIMHYQRYIDSLPVNKHEEQKMEIVQYIRLVGNVCNNILLYRS